MATNYYGKQAGSFKTAYLQHEIVDDVKVLLVKTKCFTSATLLRLRTAF